MERVDGVGSSGCMSSRRLVLCNLKGGMQVLCAWGFWIFLKILDFKVLI